MTDRVAAIYARVSTTDRGQDPAMQISSAIEFCAKKGWKYEIFQDYLSGRSNKRQEYQKMLSLVSAGAISTVVAYKLDRLARSAQELISLSDLLDKSDCDLVIVTQPILDTTGAVGKLFYRLLAVIAEFESDLISERTKDGIAEKKKSGHKFGGDRKGISYILSKISNVALSSRGWKLRIIREHFRLPRNTFYSTIEKIESAFAIEISDHTDERYNKLSEHFRYKYVDETGDALYGRAIKKEKRDKDCLTLKDAFRLISRWKNDEYLEEDQKLIINAIVDRGI